MWFAPQRISVEGSVIMGWFEQVVEWVRSSIGITFVPKLGLIDLLDILFVAFLVYQILVWFRMTRAWTLFKGVIFLLIIAMATSMLQMSMSSWLLQNTMVYGVLAVVIIFQPEIRRALEKLGHGGLFSILASEENAGQVTRETVFGDRGRDGADGSGQDRSADRGGAGSQTGRIRGVRGFRWTRL